jgi:putative ABC transport system permease protein
MAVPLKYNIRNLRVRLTTTIVTAASIALTVGVFIWLTALAVGLRMAMLNTGQPLNFIVLRQNSQTEVNSQVTTEAYDIIKFLPGIAKDPQGNPLVSPDLLVIINLERSATNDRTNVIIRGVTPAAIALRPQVKLARGKWFTPGLRELTVSKTIAERFKDTGMGDSLRFGKADWKVVGIFDGSGTTYASEIWCDVNQLKDDYNRVDYSALTAKATDSSALTGLCTTIKDDRRLQFDCLSEDDYYAQQTRTGQPIRFLGMLVAFIMSIGSSFAAMNAMYSAVANRFREVGTLRVLGFSKKSILLSFTLESLLIAVLGGMVGCLIALPVNWVTTGQSTGPLSARLPFASA